MSASEIRQATAVGWHTERGRRASNQDAVLAGTLPDGRDLIAIADGMGGHSAGEIASQAALEAMLAGLKAGQPLREALIHANAAVFAAARKNPEWTGMGTTLVALLRAGDVYHIANVGDSRAYRITERGITQLTSDHTFIAEAVSQGRLSQADAEQSRWRNALTRAIGTDPAVEVDVFGPFDAREPQCVVLCSDGLYGSVPADVLERQLCVPADLHATARRLTSVAYLNGSRDNITVAIVSFGGFGLRAKVELEDDSQSHEGVGPVWRNGRNRRGANGSLLQRILHLLKPSRDRS